MNRDNRSIVNVYETSFERYDLEGPVQDDMSVLSVSYSPETRRGVYVIRMEPGAATIPHVHECMEEFLILEGELIESDGTVLKRGDFASYRPRHPPQLAHGNRLPAGRGRLGPARTGVGERLRPDGGVALERVRRIPGHGRSRTETPILQCRIPIDGVVVPRFAPSRYELDDQRSRTLDLGHVPPYR